MSVDYDDQACCHRLAGSTARDSVTLPVPPGDRIIGVSGRYGKYVDHIKIWTAQNPVGVEAGGPGGAVDFEYHAPPGTAIIGFMGRAGQYIDAVGVCMRSQ
ncbi:jacalin-like lectin [Paraburkholderia sp. FT54]|uniref:jacalin-like lectin n=1 Tax=Paraburkholderia sp. FT54 TaxID=3074437 RepID=UPI0038F6636D